MNSNPLTGSKITQSFYQQHDVVSLARELIGVKLCSNINGVYTSGIITETEAYRGYGDRACHANENRRTSRTEIMFGPGGFAYVYLCYGMHHLFNIVTNKQDKADAVLIRSVQPLEGLDHMEKRRSRSADDPRLSSGPGNMSKALGITTTLNGSSLTQGPIWLERPEEMPQYEIIATERVGVAYAGKDALHPWRFYIKANKYVSAL